MKENQQNPYHQHVQGGSMPPFVSIPTMDGISSGAYGARRQRIRKTSVKDIFPQWLSRNALIVYFFALVVVSFMYSAYSLPWYYMISGVVAVMVFFLYGSAAIRETSLDRIQKESRYEKHLFMLSLILRIALTFLLYWLFQTNYGDAFGFEKGDAYFYDEIGQGFAKSFQKGRFLSDFKMTSDAMDVSDLGYAAYLGFIYWVTDNNILVVRLLKCIWSSLTVILIYRLSKRNFGIQIARVAAMFCALWPNFWYYCGVHLKETEMVFLGVLFVEQADQMLRSRRFTAWKVVPVLLIAATILTFRTPLALVAFLSLIFSVVMSSTRVVNWGKRIIVGVLAVLLIGVTMGNRIQEESRLLLDAVRGNIQQENMEWRARRDNGNEFAKYAGKSVFAPLIFTIPFPSMVRPWDGQDAQQLNNGGNFVKNILSGFTIFAMVMLLMSGRWREHLMPLSFMLGYLVVLTMSTFAQSERFHQPAVPFELMFAAYGLSIAVTRRKYKRWFTYWCGLMFIATIAWSWFKMAGRGLS